MYKILFTGCTLNEHEIAELKEKELQIIPAKKDLTENELISCLEDCIAVISNGNEYYTPEILSKLPNLKIIQFYGIGYSKCIDVDVANKYNKIIMNTPKVNSYSVAEFTLGLILTLNQKLLQHNEDTRNGRWEEKTFFDLKNKTIGIAGMGHIGTIVADILYKAFNSKILFYDKLAKEDEQNKYHAEKVSLDRLFKESDIVTLHLPLNDNTRNLVGYNELSLMKPSSYLINTARAEIVDSEALYDVLNKNLISGCAFDGFYEEPVNLSKNTAKLLSLPTGKFVLTPHTGYNAVEGDSRVKKMCINNLLQFFNTGTSNSIVNK